MYQYCKVAADKMRRFSDAANLEFDVFDLHCVVVILGIQAKDHSMIRI